MLLNKKFDFNQKYQEIRLKNNFTQRLEKVKGLSFLFITYSSSKRLTWPKW